MRFLLACLLLLEFVAAGSSDNATGVHTVDDWYTTTKTEDHWSMSTTTKDEWYTTTKTTDHYFTSTTTSTSTTTTTTTTTKPTTSTTTTTTTKPITTTTSITTTTTKNNTTTTTTTFTQPSSTTTTTTKITTTTQSIPTTTTTVSTTTTTVPVPTTTTVYSTIFLPTVSTCPSVTRTITSTTTTTTTQPGIAVTSTTIQSGALTTITLTTIQSGNAITLTTTQSGNAITITSIQSITSVQPPVTSTITSPATSSCDFCKIELYGTELAYPTLIVTTTYYLTTVSYIPTQYPNGTRVTNIITTVRTPDACLTSPPPSTWQFSNSIILTSPTHYVYVSSGVHGFLYPSVGVYGGCGLSFTPLAFPTTNVPALLASIGLSNITTTETAAPTKIVAYLDTLPTVNAQLNGSLVASCDGAGVDITPFAGYTATASSGVINPGTTTVTAADQTPPPG